jgi:cell division protein FtsW
MESREKDIDNSCWSKQQFGGANPYSLWTSTSLYWAPACVCLAVISLVILSVCEVYSATIAGHGNHYVVMQTMWVTLGIIGAAIIAFILPLKKIYDWSHLWLILIGVPLAYLAFAQCMVHVHRSWISFFPFATEINGAVRWLKIGPIQIQPSEFGKIAVILFLAAYYGRLGRDKTHKLLNGLIVPGVCAGFILLMMILGKDMSTTVITAGTVGSIMYLAGVDWKHLLAVLLAVVLLGTAVVIHTPWRMKRITSFMKGRDKIQQVDKASDDDRYQIDRSLMCLGSGGTTGTGYADGYMKTYLPENHTDFIIAVIGEEFGLLGIYFVIGCYLTICGGIMLIARECRARSDLLLCMGVAVIIAAQSFVNLGVISDSIPSTGLTAPFLSYGGSSMLCMMALIGLVMNVALRNNRFVRNEVQARNSMRG